MLIPEANFGGTTPVDWRDVIVVDEGDDEDGDESDSSVVAMLGFDPDDEEEDLGKAYSPDQPRDERGRFSSDGGSSSKVTVPSREDQAKVALSLKSYADMVTSIQPKVTDAISTDAIISANGKPYYFDGESFSGSRKTQGLCYQEAGRAALDGRGTYVEGYVSVHGVPIHHAWTADEDGRVHDPTLRDGAGVKGYFGVPFKTDYVRETILRTRVWGMFDYHNPKIYRDEPGEYVKKLAKVDEGDFRLGAAILTSTTRRP